MPHVSVIIPNYNHAPYLRQRIDSVLNQTFQDFEVIILDDCSTDNSWEVIKDYENHPNIVHIERNKVNSGSPFKQWKKGIELAKGEWIWIAESDDWAEREFLTELLTFKEPMDVLVSCLSEMMNGENKSLGYFNWGFDLEPEKWSNSFHSPGFLEIENSMLYKNTIPNASACIFKKPNHFPDEILSMKYCGDWFFWITMLTMGSFSYVYKPLNKFRFHNNTTRSRKSSQKERQRFKEYFTQIDYAKTILKRNSRKHAIDKANYDWVINELLTKINKLGRLSRIALVPPLPLWLLSRYYTAYTKKIFHDIYR